MRIFFDRVMHNRIRMFLYGILLLFPSLEIVLYIYNVIIGDAVLMPDYAFFLTSNSAGIGHVIQVFFLWFMPLYCLVMTADDCIEDFCLGYKNILVSKIGRKNYVISHLKKSFVMTFLMVTGAMLINLLLVHIVFDGGQYSPYSDELITSSFHQWEMNHPLLTNIVFMIITAIVIGMISMVGTILGIVLHNKKVVYGVTMLLWIIPFLQKKSLMLLFQPFSEYDLDTLIPLMLEVIIIYVVVIVIGYIKEVYFEK